MNPDDIADNMADVLSANLRGMKELSAQFDTITSAFWVMAMLCSLLAGIGTFYLIRRLIND